MSSYPDFTRNEQSPALPPQGSAVVLALGSPSPEGRIAHGAFRVTAEDRASLAPGPLRPRLFVFVLGRDQLRAWVGRPGGDAVVFSDDEPASGEVEGWFHVLLEDCCRMSEPPTQLCDVVAALGPWKSAAVELRGR